MRRRSTVTVWPAFTDLMTVLAVVGFTTAVGLVHEQQQGGDSEAEVARLRASLTSAEARVAELESQLQTASRESAEALQRQQDAHLAEVQTLERMVIRNQRLLNATEEVQRIIEGIGRDDVIQFGVDQSVQFGDDLVRFPLNSMEPEWTAGGREKLREFCSRLETELGALSARRGDRGVPFVLQVEGHTDRTTCYHDPQCNWRFAVGRAVRFAELMREDVNCPGGGTLEMLPVGYADTRPLAAGRPEAVAVRRISLRLLPDYRRLLEGTW